MKIDIETPCNEDWNSMKIGMISRHCDVCEKKVFDFTSKSKEEILTFLLQNQGQSTCGRLRKSQLDFHHNELEIIIEGLRKQKNNKYAFAILSLACLMLVSCNEENKRKPIQETSVELVEKEVPEVGTITWDTTQQVKILKVDTVQHKQCAATTSSIIDSLENELNLGEEFDELDVILGIMIPYESDSSVYVTEKMPEFVGGVDSLFAFLGNNIVYPEWEKKNKIEGKVYVSFVIEKDGLVSNVKILRGVEGAKNFDAEVLRVMALMPNWIPGENLKGEKVDVHYNLPINFKLKDSK